MVTFSNPHHLCLLSTVAKGFNVSIIMSHVNNNTIIIISYVILDGCVLCSPWSALGFHWLKFSPSAKLKSGYVDYKMWFSIKWLKFQMLK